MNLCDKPVSRANKTPIEQGNGTKQTVSTGVPSYGNLVDVVYSVPMAYRGASCQWVSADSMTAAIRKITDTTGQPIWQPSVIAGQPDVLMGYEFITDPNMTAIGTAAGTALAFGDWSGWYLRDVGIRFDVSPDFAFANDITSYRVIQRLDAKWIDKSGVRGMKSPTT